MEGLEEEEERRVGFFAKGRVSVSLMGKFRIDWSRKFQDWAGPHSKFLPGARRRQRGGSGGGGGRQSVSYGTGNRE